VYTEWNTAFRKSQVTCSYQNETSAPVPEKKKDGLMELVLEDVAPFKDEDYMPPQADYRAAVLCYYGGHEFISPESFWPESQKRIAKYIEEFIGNPSAFRDDAASAVGAETDPEQKLRKLYARAQQIRNLSYERERTPEEEKRENLKPNSTAQDVLKHGYGTHSEIDAVFVGLARAAGFEASVLGVSDRQEHSFSKMILSLGQLNGVAVLIHVNGKDVLLDPGTRFCPYGVLSWKHSAVPALNFKTGGEFITTPPPPSTLMHRMADLDLAADGSAKGELTVALRGPEALEHRLEALQTDDAGRRKSFEDEVQAWLPGEATVKMTDSKGWDSVEDDLVARFTVDIPNFASVTGKRLIIPTYLFSTPRKGLFTIELRMYPITFPYPLTETDQVTVKWPDTYSLEEPPYRRKADLKYANYEISASAESKQLVTNRILRFDGLSFLPEKYPELRNFFTVVEAGDASHAVLEQAHAADAKNPQ
jgi:hypothetical protein